jgi:hypothetical protein
LSYVEEAFKCPGISEILYGWLGTVLELDDSRSSFFSYLATQMLEEFRTLLLLGRLK